MKLSLFLSSLLLLGTPLFAQSPASAEASAFSSSVRPPDFPWWRDGRFGMFIHWGPALLTGKEISWSRIGTGIEKYDSLYKEFNPVKFNATVSSSIAPQFMHTAQAALDDDASTYWTPGRDEAMAEEIMGKQFEHVRRMPNHPVWIRNGWLEVDLGKPQTVSRARIQEYGGYSPIASWKIESENNGTWQVIAEGKTIGTSFDVPISTPATARKFRLSIEADGRPAIAEFQLF
jgi:hypothetical protein